MLDLRDGTKLVLEVGQDPNGKGYTLEIGKRVGSRSKTISTKRVGTEEELWLAIARWADQKLAQLGMEKIGK